MISYKAAHRFSSGNRNLVVMSDNCGCFHCLAIFKPTSIFAWTDGKEWEPHATALCPKCGIDSVLPSEAGFPITKEFLKAMENHWFAHYSA